MVSKLINLWHTWLDMPKHDLSWHQQDLSDEMDEFVEETGLIARWSELSDVVYTSTRAHWSGHKEIRFPYPWYLFFLGAVYMFPKYSLRWSFYRKLGKKLNSAVKLTEVRNPQKIEKLEKIAHKYNLDPARFTAEAKKLMRHWVFLK